MAGRARKRGTDLVAELSAARRKLAAVDAWLVGAASDGGPMDLGALAAILDGVSV